MGPDSPVVMIGGTFVDDLVAEEVAEALGRWLRWIHQGSEGKPPPAFEPLGVDTGDWAWALGDDVDWELGPHARAVGSEVRISLETHDTHTRLCGLLRALGARATRVVRDGDATASSSY